MRCGEQHWQDSAPPPDYKLFSALPSEKDIHSSNYPAAPQSRREKNHCHCQWNNINGGVNGVRGERDRSTPPPPPLLLLLSSTHRKMKMLSAWEIFFFFLMAKKREWRTQNVSLRYLSNVLFLKGLWGHGRVTLTDWWGLWFAESKVTRLSCLHFASYLFSLTREQINMKGRREDYASCLHRFTVFASLFSELSPAFS